MSKSAQIISSENEGNKQWLRGIIKSKFDRYIWSKIDNKVQIQVHELVKMVISQTNYFNYLYLFHNFRAFY